MRKCALRSVSRRNGGRLASSSFSGAKSRSSLGPGGGGGASSADTNVHQPTEPTSRARRSADGARHPAPSLLRRPLKTLIAHRLHERAPYLWSLRQCVKSSRRRASPEGCPAALRRLEAAGSTSARGARL